MSARTLLAALVSAALVYPASAEHKHVRAGASPNIAAACASVDPWSEKSWSTPAPPAHVFGNTWYVGTCGITVLLVETQAGLVLLDGGPPKAAPLVVANIRKLGFDPRQVRWILVSHEHWDHAGALAALQKATGAKVIAGPHQAASLRSGKPSGDDPQLPFFTGHDLQPVKVSHKLADKRRQTVGGIAFTAIATPAHAPGSTSWQWRDCEGRACKTLAYADSVSTPAPDSYRFSDHPGRARDVRRGMEKMAAISCDVLITPHPAQSDLLARLSGSKPLAEIDACRAYAEAGVKRFEERVANEQKPVTTKK